MTAYATADDLALVLPAAGTTRDPDLLDDLLNRASTYLDARTERTFTSGMAEARLFDVRSRSYVPITRGVFSVSLVEQAPTENGTFVALASDCWSLRPRNPAPEKPYGWIHLHPSVSGHFWPHHWGDSWDHRWSGPVLRVTGVYDFPTVPAIIRAGTLALAREMFASLPGRPGGGEVDANGIPRWLPEETYRAIEWGRKLGPWAG